MPFVKGQSGNKRGRPRVENAAANLARKHVVEATEKLVAQMRGDDEQLAQKAAINLLDRAHGKPAQAIVGDKDYDPLAISGIKITIVDEATK